MSPSTRLAPKEAPPVSFEAGDLVGCRRNPGRYRIGRLDSGVLLPIVKQMPNHSNPLDSMFHALSDPTRRQVVERLCAGPASVKELAAPLDMSLPSVMQHLAVLETCGLVASTKIGRVRTCTLQPETLSLAEQWLDARRIGWSNRLDRLGSFLDAQDEPTPGDDT